MGEAVNSESYEHRAAICARVVRAMRLYRRQKRRGLWWPYELVARAAQVPEREVRRALNPARKTPVPLGIKQAIAALSREWPGGGIGMREMAGW